MNLNDAHPSLPEADRPDTANGAPRQLTPTEDS
jgi:hypothetical protein